MGGKPMKAKAVAVAVVALAKCLINQDPAIAGQLAQILDSASKSGLTSADLELLRLIVKIGAP